MAYKVGVPLNLALSSLTGFKLFLSATILLSFFTGSNTQTDNLCKWSNADSSQSFDVVCKIMSQDAQRRMTLNCSRTRIYGQKLGLCSLALPNYPFCELNLLLNYATSYSQLLSLISKIRCTNDKVHTNIIMKYLMHNGNKNTGDFNLLDPFDLERMTLEEFNLTSSQVSTSAESAGFPLISQFLKPISQQIKSIYLSDIRSDSRIAPRAFDFSGAQNLNVFSIRDSTFKSIDKKAIILDHLNLFEIVNVEFTDDLVEASPIVLQWPDCSKVNRISDYRPQIRIEKSLKSDQIKGNLLYINYTCQEPMRLILDITDNYFDRMIPANVFRKLLGDLFNHEHIHIEFKFDTVDCCHKDNRWLFQLFDKNMFKPRNIVAIQCKDLGKNASNYNSTTVDDACGQYSKTQILTILLIFIILGVILLITVSGICLLFVIPRSKGNTISIGRAGMKLHHSSNAGSTTETKAPSIIEIKSTQTDGPTAKSPLLTATKSGHRSVQPKRVSKQSIKSQSMTTPRSPLMKGGSATKSPAHTITAIKTGKVSNADTPKPIKSTGSYSLIGHPNSKT